MIGDLGLTIEDESGFAGAAEAVEEERETDAVLLSVVVQNRLEKRPWDDPPWLLRH